MRKLFCRDEIGKGGEDDAEAVCACVRIADGFFTDGAGSAERCDNGFGGFCALNCGFRAFVQTDFEAVARFCRGFQSVCARFQSINQGFVADDCAFAEALLAGFVNAGVCSLENGCDIGE